MMQLYMYSISISAHIPFSGKLYVYELRNVKVPSQVIEAHRSAVTCISEQLPLKVGH